MTEQEYKKYIYEKADKIRTKKELEHFITEIVKTKDLDYGKIVYAICGSMIATCNYIDRSPVGGITGFQAGFIGWEMVKEYLIRTNNDCGMKIINYGELLYPQYKDRTDKLISSSTWKALQERASEKLKEVPDAHPKVIKHWKKIVKGKVPFGYKVKKD